MSVVIDLSPNHTEGGGGGGAVDSVNGMTGVVVITKATINLGNVANLSPANLPISTATNTALSQKLSLSGGVMTGAILSNAGGYLFDADTGLAPVGDGQFDILNNGFTRVRFNQGGIWEMNGQPMVFPYNPATALGQTLIITDVATGQLDYGSPTITGNANRISYFNGSGILTDVASTNINGVLGLDFNIQIAPDGTGGINVFNDSIQFRPTANAANDGYSLKFLNVEFDVDSSGFPMSTANGIAIDNVGITHNGTGDIGYIQRESVSINIGNGTDPLSMNGFQVANANGTIYSGVTVVQNIQGYSVGLNMQPGSIMGAGAYVNVFGDYNNFNTTINSYNSYIAGPIINTISNNNNYTAYQVNANITTFQGNAGYTGISVGGNLGTFGTGGYSGINISPNIASIVNANGLVINMNSVTASGTKRAIDVTGDVNINGALNFSGGLTIGQLSAFAATTIVSGAGNPTSVNSLVSQLNIPASSTNTLADTLGLNTAMLLNIGANSTTTSGPFGLGMAAIALPCVIVTEAGSTIDYVTAAGYAAVLDGSSTGGTIENLHLCVTKAVPNGITTVNNLRGFYFDLPFGDPGINTWGFYNGVSTSHNWFGTDLKIGGTAGSTDKVSNSSIALEIESTTKGFMNARMTTLEKLALTALPGLEVYDTTLNQKSYYNGTIWVDY